ncbi:GDSL-type esterase/lipase family protein [Maribacter halichondriae]|uniref:GDSL-type esterase/lipase family protein n=1 Tax=Maribacter halichondriae TaxID=2980554 RepID=UPI0023581A79|nr:GDSL-type esterase/lipase family protein [Maribacter sp. Hal144]
MRYIVVLFLFSVLAGYGQDPLRFASEIEDIQKKYDSLWDSSKETIVFTGSSSIRIWSDLEKRFPEHHIVNSGFGGSQASDLLAHSEALILRYKPKKVFIYEGDNDIASEKKPKEIMATTQEIIARIRGTNPTTKIVLIAAKPSIARWNLKRNYKKLNRKFRRMSQKDVLIDYADVWRPMLEKRKVKQDIFLEDGLHMNSKGYDLWYEVIKNYVD